MTSTLSTGHISGVRSSPVAVALLVAGGGRGRGRASHQGGVARPDRLLRLDPHQAVLALEGPGAGMLDSTWGLILASLMSFKEVPSHLTWIMIKFSSSPKFMCHNVIYSSFLVVHLHLLAEFMLSASSLCIREVPKWLAVEKESLHSWLFLHKEETFK